MIWRILTTNIDKELDIVSVRQRARKIAALCGFGMQDQVRISTSVSELARNVFNYAVRGEIEFLIFEASKPQVLEVRITDRGPGIGNLDVILAGGYRSKTGMGLGIIGARRLMDHFSIETNADADKPGASGTTGTGTKIVLQKILPPDAPRLTEKELGDFAAHLQLNADSTLAEVQRQNQELLRTLAELKAKQEDLLHMTEELEDTNRGIVALYAELDEKADQLRLADQMKSRFLSNMSHEFRTPLSSIRALSKLLLDRVDGELSPEQEKQVAFILAGASNLADLVDDLLDLAKIEAGKVDIRPIAFGVSDMFRALRGMLKPLLLSEKLALTFCDLEHDVKMHTDEAKVSQILRNFISNALKFTERGEIRVSAERTLDGKNIKFKVSDTGIGIDEKNLQFIFEEFSQVESRLQRGVRGTGLGLPLCRNLASVLHGSVAVESTPGNGSTFSVVIPIVYQDFEMPVPIEFSATGSRESVPVLVLEDRPQMRMLYGKFFAETEFRLVAARSLREANDLWPGVQPHAVILDILLNGEESWQWLADLKNDPVRKHIPVIIASEVKDKRKGLALGADAYYVKPLFKQELLATLRMFLSRQRPAAGLIVGDTEMADRHELHRTTVHSVSASS